MEDEKGETRNRRNIEKEKVKKNLKKNCKKLKTKTD